MVSIRSPQTIFHFWEYIFFTGAIGTIALYPYIFPLLPIVLTDAPLMLLLTTTAFFAFITAVFLAQFTTDKKIKWAVFAAITAGAFTLLLGQSALFTSPAFAIWSVDVALMTCAFGYLFAKRLLRRSEHTLMKNAGHIILAGFSINAVALLVAALTAMLPPLFVALVTVALFLVITLP